MQTDTSWQSLILNLQVRVPLHRVISTHTPFQTLANHSSSICSSDQGVCVCVGGGSARGETRSRSICAQWSSRELPEAQHTSLSCQNATTELKGSQAEEKTETERGNQTSRTMSFCPLGLRRASEKTSISLLLESPGTVVHSGFGHVQKTKSVGGS